MFPIDESKLKTNQTLLLQLHISGIKDKHANNVSGFNEQFAEKLC